MNIRVVLTLTGAGILLAGCVDSRQRLVLDPVGPPPASVAQHGTTSGTLVVYSAFSVNFDFNARDPYRQEYSDYRIFSQDGKFLQRVHNDSGLDWSSPAAVSLPAGRYRVTASANGYGAVTVPVQVEANRTTTVHLEGDSSWPDKSLSPGGNAVRLPDGRFVGWRLDS